MLKAYIIIFCLTFCLRSAYAQTKEASIANIRREFQSINSNKSLKIIRLKNEQIPGPATDGGQELTGYFEGGEVRKVKVEIGLSWGISKREYYLKNGKLFFVYLRDEAFAHKSDGEVNYKKLNLSSECRYYLDKGEVLELRSLGRSVFENIAVKTGAELTAEALSYVKMLKAASEKI